jgi:hypothetical protein
MGVFRKEKCLATPLGAYMSLNPTLAKILAPAYAPCVEFQCACTEMRWIPSQGRVPRGFFGASGLIEDVEIVLVFAEPGNPYAGECHTGIESAYKFASIGFEIGKDLFHRNVRAILEMCWPWLTFEQRMQRAWLTESVLCSAPKEGGSVSVAASRACGQRYLLDQLRLFPSNLLKYSKARRVGARGLQDSTGNQRFCRPGAPTGRFLQQPPRALVVALGSKAAGRLKSLGVVNFVRAHAASPPGCNLQGAQPSWKRIADELHLRRKRLA